ncbi:hypothetical protein [Sphingomonas melonis]|uniref:Uncharacterized protein n=1 Tax=Sphingomonas melonis TaxID=152682 RepID=A0A7Y9FRF0_9SPHN|nr:hypothetical protein [Sphingomonas melonis]NYD91827.1 hypothetical protein [Sphingomonas melonis]
MPPPGFNDKRLDANLASILGLRDQPPAPPPEDVARAAPTLHRVRSSRRASATVAASLGIALLAGVGLVVGRSVTTHQPAPVPHRVIDLPTAPGSVPAPAAAVTAAPRPALVRHHRTHATPSPAAPSVPSTPLLAEALAEAMRNSAAPTPAAEAPPAVAAAPRPAATEPPAPRPSAAATPNGPAPDPARARRDGVDAIRALRRQW